MRMGLALTRIHLVLIRVTKTRVSPARGTGRGVFAGGEDIARLWLLWLGRMVGGVWGAEAARGLGEGDKKTPA